MLTETDLLRTKVHSFVRQILGPTAHLNISHSSFPLE